MLVTGDLAAFVDTLISGIGIDDLVIVTDQVRDLVQIMHVRTGSGYRVDVPNAWQPASRLQLRRFSQFVESV